MKDLKIYFLNIVYSGDNHADGHKNAEPKKKISTSNVNVDIITVKQKNFLFNLVLQIQFECDCFSNRTAKQNSMYICSFMFIAFRWRERKTSVGNIDKILHAFQVGLM